MDIFNNREWSVAFWLMMILAWIVSKRDTRGALLDVLKVFFNWHIQLPIIILFIYITSIIYVLYAINWWTISLLKDTIFWFCFVALVLMFKVVGIKVDVSYFKSIVLDNIKIITILQFVSNTYTFSFFVEFLIVPTLSLLTLFQAFAETKIEENPDFRKVHTLFTRVLSISGICILSFALWGAVEDFHNFSSAEKIKEFILPFVLSLCFLPFIYLFTTFLLYEKIFVRVTIQNRDSSLAKCLKRSILKRFHLNLFELNNWSMTKPNLTIRHCRETERVSNWISGMNARDESNIDYQ